ncbi:hypothetical protein BLAC_00335 [Bifidobacterium animalis subsp. lactis ATCC 27673]|nr:hypothetical protein BLAC_00335 [Bifidobacterium animalis subsp. lactis ATCC 27673]
MRRIHDALARGPLRQFRARNLAAGNLVECERQVKPGHVAFRVQCQFAHVFAGMRAYEFACFL